MQANTDWGMRRRGAWHDQLLATERCLEVGIAPRWQLFVTKRCLDDLGAFAALVKRLELAERCRAIGQEFVFYGVDHRTAPCAGTPASGGRRPGAHSART